MNNTEPVNPMSTVHPIEAIIDAGFHPADDVAQGELLDASQRNPTWIGRFDGAIPLNAGLDGYVLARHDDDRVTVTRVDKYGVIYAEVAFAAPDDTILPLNAAALAAVVKAWVSL